MHCYLILIIGAVAVGNGLPSQATNYRKLPGEGSTEFRLTKLLNIELGGEPEKLHTDLRKTILSGIKGFEEPLEPVGAQHHTSLENYSQKEIVMVLKDLYSELIALRENMSTIANYSKSERIVQSNILEGISFPIGVSYHRWCPSSILNKEIIGTEQHFPRNCKEIQEQGNNISGIYQIHPKQSEKPFRVLCDMETNGGGWTYIQKRYEGSVDFFLGWREYKFGFGDLGSEFWLGLENIYKLTGFEVNELLVEIVNRDYNKAYAHYKAFGIGSEVEGYSLNVLKDFSGDAGDSLVYHLGAKFSTKDFDQDANSGNCAISASGAWWYKSCFESNLNGKYINTVLPESYKYQGMQWKGFKGVEYSHAKSRMMIRPVG